MSTEVPVASSPAPVPPAARTPKKPRVDVYTVMLGIALFAICLACLFLFMEWNRYNREIIPGKPFF